MTTLTITGTVAPVVALGDYLYGIDFGGYFGPPGTSLAGLPFTVAWEGTFCDCFGNVTIQLATLTINNRTINFGVGVPAFNDFSTTLQQVQTHGGDFFSLTTRPDSFAPIPGHNGVFYIHEGNDGSTYTQAFLTIPPNAAPSVPLPPMATGPGFTLALLLLSLAWKVLHHA